MGLRTKGGRLGFALSAAKVLAEFGDSSVYELALEQALKGKMAKKRLDSIIILTELGRTIDGATLKAKGINLEDVLIVIAECWRAPRKLYHC